ncbi:porin [Microvirga alba]|uniref:Porin n=1 Tax=Microvirga alba TaxID=2791025 RepID=A0A931BRU7_9HYPH|nr:porin [Microvirga alba]MBF9233493.1 porin [Microvirga alba]
MKIVKSLMLGSVAGLAAVAGAQAADLPAKKAAPVEYVRVCSTYGAGFFYIPGTETCLRVGGRVRADYVYGEPRLRAQDAVGFRASGRIQTDARTATAYGLLRTFVRFDIIRSSGRPFNGTNGTISSSPNVAEAFIQFGGLTVGHVTSFFDNGDLRTEHLGTLRFSDSPDVDLLAYTFTLGNGFSTTLSLENGLERRNNGFFPGGLAATQLNYAGERVPDLVGNVKYEATWGTAQISGAVHQIRSRVLSGAGFAVPILGSIPSNEYGFAVTGQVGVNLPMIAAGDAMWFAATYANGALGYIIGGNDDFIIDGSVRGAVADAYINPITGNIVRGRGWALAGGVTHYWTPQIRQSVFGSYARFDYGTGASTVTPAGIRIGLDDFNEWRVGTNAFWQPVPGLDFGVEVLYARIDPRGRVAIGDNISAGSSNAWEGRLHIQRDF